jgi:hypothetical protein
MRKTLDPEVLIFHARPGGKLNKRYPLRTTRAAAYCQVSMKGIHFCFVFFASLTLDPPNINEATFRCQT